MNEKTMTRTDRFALRIADAAIQHPWRVILPVSVMQLSPSSMGAGVS